MARYTYLDKSQGLFLTVCLDQQLIPGSFEYTLNYLIDQVDLSAFDAAFHKDQLGAPAPQGLWIPRTWRRACG
jgi:hypothetical protein